MTASPEMTATPETRPERPPARETADLDRHYGKIGMRAVAAAVRYPSAARNEAYRPARTPDLVHEDAVV